MHACLHNSFGREFCKLHESPLRGRRRGRKAIKNTTNAYSSQTPNSKKKWIMKSGVNMYEAKIKLKTTFNHTDAHCGVYYIIYMLPFCSWMSVVGQIFSRRRHGRESKSTQKIAIKRIKRTLSLPILCFFAFRIVLYGRVWSSRWIYYYSDQRRHLAKFSSLAKNFLLLSSRKDFFFCGLSHGLARKKTHSGRTTRRSGFYGFWWSLFVLLNLF